MNQSVLHRIAREVRENIDDFAREEGYDGDVIGPAVEGLGRVVARRFGFDLLTAHMLALDAVSEAWLAENDTT